MNARLPVSPVFELPESLLPAARHIWEIFDDATHGQLRGLISSLPPVRTSGWFPISMSFYDMIRGDVARIAERYNLPEGLSDFRKMEPLACCFYLINSLHETLLPPEKLDRYDRYPFRESIQYAAQITEINYCQKIFEEIFSAAAGKPLPEKDSRIFWSHDIDYLYSAWKSDLIEKWRNRKPHHMPPVLWERFRHGHRWDNIEEILLLEKEHGIRSVFFWLAVRGKRRLKSGAAIDHADYDFKSRKTKDLWHKIAAAGSVNGLHKSAFDLDFQEELKNLPGKTNINRNHYLRARFPDHYYKIERSGLTWDSSLGFAEHIGFRNSYGRPFRPFDLKNNRSFSFYEIPLHIMDTTLIRYMNMAPEDAVRRICTFVSNHASHSVLSILLHNSHLNFFNSSGDQNWQILYKNLKKFSSYIP